MLIYLNDSPFPVMLLLKVGSVKDKNQSSSTIELNLKAQVATPESICTE